MFDSKFTESFNFSDGEENVIFFLLQLKVLNKPLSGKWKLICYESLLWLKLVGTTFNVYIKRLQCKFALQQEYYLIEYLLTGLFCSSPKRVVKCPCIFCEVTNEMSPLRILVELGDPDHLRPL